jgi:hypothetical protein
MAVYLVYVQPFREYLMLQVLGGNYTDYVWSNVGDRSTHKGA